LTSTPSKLDLSEPLIGGYALARPTGETELSITAALTDEAELYLHPRLRVALATHNQPLPKYQRMYDIYAFGLLLAEIGFWGTVPRLAIGAVLNETTMRAVPAKALKDTVMGKCNTDLACWMKEDIVISP
jgi:hypothetical protein